MKKNLVEHLDRIHRLMPKLIQEENLSNNRIDMQEATSPTTGVGGQYLDQFMKSIGMETIDKYFEKALVGLKLISREADAEAPILFDKVTRRITNINWDKMKPVDIENLMKLEPIRNAFEKQFIKTNKINLELFAKDKTTQQTLKIANPRFANLVDQFIAQTGNKITKQNVAQKVWGVTKDVAVNTAKLFTDAWQKNIVNWFNKNIGTKRIFQIFQSNLRDQEVVKLREQGEDLFKRYAAYLNNDGGKTPFNTRAFEQEIYEYLLKVNTYTKTVSGKIWQELRKNMPEEVEVQFFGQTLKNGQKLEPIFSVQRLQEMITHFSKLDTRLSTEWTGWFQGFARLVDELFFTYRKGNFWSSKLRAAERLINMGLGFESRTFKEFLDNIESQGGSIGAALKKEIFIRGAVMYTVYPAFMSAWEVFKVQYTMDNGHSPYLKLGYGQAYLFQVTFNPDNVEDKDFWLNVGKEDAAFEIWKNVFNKNFKQRVANQGFRDLFWRSPIYEKISAYAKDPKTSEKNEDAAFTEADRIYNEALLKYQKELRTMLYEDPRYKEIQNKDSIYQNAIKFWQDSASRSRTDTKNLIQDDEIEIKK